MPGKSNFPNPREIRNFYEGLDSEEMLVRVGAQLCPLRNDQGHFSTYRKYQSLRSSTSWELSFAELRYDDERIFLDKKVVPLPYKPSQVAPKTGRQVLDREMLVLGKKTAIQRERKLISKILRDIKPSTFAGGTSRETVALPLPLTCIQEAKIEFEADPESPIAYILAGGRDYGSVCVRPFECFVLISHCDVVRELRRHKKFFDAKKYSSHISTSEVGRINNIRILESSHIPVHCSAGAHVEDAKPNLIHTEEHINVYPVIFARSNAWVSVPLRRIGDRYDPHFENLNEDNDWWIQVEYIDAYEIQNPDWIVILEVGAIQTDY